MNLDEHAKLALDRAREEARRLGHAEVTPLHLFAALPRTAKQDVILPRPAHRNDLAARLATELQAIPGTVTSSYRTSARADAVLSPASVKALERARGLLGWSKVTAEALFDELAIDPKIAGIIEGARLGIELFETAALKADQHARRANANGVGFCHLFDVLRETAWLPRAFAHLDATISTSTKTGNYRGALERMRALEGHTPWVDEFLVRALIWGHVDELLEGETWDAGDLAYTIVHDGVRTVPESGTTIVFHPDDFTPPEVIRQIARDVGVTSPRDAIPHEIIHQEAPRIARAMIESLRRSRFPLKITCT